MKARVDKEVGQAVQTIEQKLLAGEQGLSKTLTLPEDGYSADKIKQELGVLGDMKRTRWEEGKVSGAVYHGEDELLDVQLDAMRRFMVANPIHADGEGNPRQKCPCGETG